MACSIHVKPGMYAKKNMQLQMKNALTQSYIQSVQICRYKI